ncbi:CPBP family intramembrane glutamic endopeptidase [Mucilaginibacter glaciei]|uniref:CPBP family intramembrane metalloprotease n=1 Tax=Mucilaginibacter glaciei TaxID=2772109 RepID=A0A926S1W1_9SPHI|nr:CPBP family intramembrane glutamic endopeptidase [Mucilaginibacter glaciei]MBD1393488.1 CPBP family intramembrane metalloprotease [Mucilaginibacter glaciei]
MVKKPVNQMTPGLQFVVILLFTILVVLICNLLAIGLIMLFYGFDEGINLTKGLFNGPNIASELFLLQLLGATAPLFIAPAFFANVIVKEPRAYLKATFRFQWMLIVVVFFVMLISSPLIELSANINQKMVLPEFLKGLEEWMKRSEEAAKKLTAIILRMDNIGDCIKNVILIGLLTAIAEEFLFRGVLQTIMQRWTKNTHATVWITAALFSAFHMEFYGFLPRMFLGALFGYFVAWSGSIWPAVWGHFINNGSIVVVTYLFQHKIIKIDPDDQHVFNYTGYVFSFIIIIILLAVYKKIASGQPSPEINGEELG